MNAFIAWLKSKNVTSHSIAVTVISAAGLIMSDEQVRTLDSRRILCPPQDWHRHHWRCWHHPQILALQFAGRGSGAGEASPHLT